uniref:Uncharacterized protein n=1 Tax=Anguilla anguilla TaxID=7936 RepID=A0A0E9QXE0_ANGAN
MPELQQEWSWHHGRS